MDKAPRDGRLVLLRFREEDVKGWSRIVLARWRRVERVVRSSLADAFSERAGLWVHVNRGVFSYSCEPVAWADVEGEDGWRADLSKAPKRRAVEVRGTAVFYEDSCEGFHCDAWRDR